MVEYFYSVARLDDPKIAGELGWVVLRHDGKEVVPASRVFLSWAEAYAEACRLITPEGPEDA